MQPALRTAEGVSQSVVGEGCEPVSADSNLRFRDALAPVRANRNRKLVDSPLEGTVLSELVSVFKNTLLAG